MARQEKAVHSAEYWEKRARRKKLARQRQLRRRIAAAAVVFVVLAVIIGVAVQARKEKKCHALKSQNTNG